MLTTQKDKQDGKLVLTLSGRLDTMTAPQLEQDVNENVEGISELVFDLGELEYISSAGLRVLLASQKIMNKQGNMIVRNVSESVNEIFEVTGFCDILSIE